MKWGNIEEKEMYGTFNMGVGMILIFDEEELAGIVGHLKEQGEKYFLLGRVKKGDEGVVLW